MLNYLRKTTSLNNLHCHKLQGQIATLLMLLMVGVILFILTTVNMGKASITSTILANAADTAALQLASVFATESHYWWEAFDEDNDLKQCTTGGLLGVLAAIVLVVVAIVFQLYPLALVGIEMTAGAIVVSLIIVGAAAGSLTMGIGTLIKFGDASGFARGAIDGARVGAAIAGGAQLGGAIGSIFGTWGGIIAGCLTGMILFAGTTVYLYAQQEAAFSEAMRKNIEKIPNRYISLRENIFYTALLPIVTDPERVRDVNDIDKDGDTEEKVSAFQDWFYWRVQGLKRGGGIPIIQRFVDTLNSLVLDEDNANSVKDFMLRLSREEVECDCSGCPGVLCGEGPLIEMFRRLRNNPETGAGYRDIPFWRPGPNKAQLLTWYNCGTETCSPPTSQGFDTVDFVHKEYEELIDTAEAIVTKDIAALNASYDWIGLFYDRFTDATSGCETTNETDFYCRLSAILNGRLLENPPLYPMLPSSSISWATRISAIRNGLRDCQLAYSSHVPRGLVDSRDNPSCGEPYNPAPLDDPEANPFYPCIWFLGEELSNPALGANLPNYPCRLPLNSKNSMLNQIGIIDGSVAGLPNSILNDSRNTNDFALPTTPCTAPSVLVPNSRVVTIDVTNISLSGTKQPPYSNSFATGTSNLNYTFNYNVRWRCVNSSGTTPTYTSHNSGDQTKTLSNSLWGVTRVVEIIEANSSNQGPFATIIDKFRDFLAQMTTSVSAITTANFNTGTFASLDVDLDDEFMPVMQTLNTHPTTVQQLMDAMKKLGEDIKALGTSVDPPNGAGSAIYRWPDRQTGPYAASAETGPFLFPKYRQTKTGGWLLNKKCQQVDYYCDNISRDCISDRNMPIGRTWVRVGREEPANVAIRSSVFNLGFWNPFRGFNKINITKTCYPYYNFREVGIARRR